ncbi:MAG: hypothetical protein CFH41_01155 [Alphaproteobacteria bacterium MarineAlpha11_Bin1]|nr:MAG: hypothetical protein CFH41_01155 [Alphaproteobacteria bacterium MarineAlpha11_Bin1]|tara:strand:+ start:21522 stop:22211 length:690 start_codon:yes stop_codon:yes gene_type:complete
MTSETKITTKLEGVRSEIVAAANEVGRDPDSVSLIAVSKSQPQELVVAALRSGHRVFGENRIQEAKGKWLALKDAYPDCILHLIGPLQSNKAGDAVALFDIIQTLDREKLAQILAREMDRQDRRPEVFVQVNTGEEPQKNGVLLGEVDAFIEKCRGEYSLPVVGLMCIPPIGENAALHFALLGEIADRNDLSRLSMGMSADYQTGVRLGATEVRVGTAIFGIRIAGVKQ